MLLMTEYTAKDISDMQAKIKGLESTITEFRQKGCSIPRCAKCGELLEDLYEDVKGHIHLSCDNCDWVDYKDTKISHKCGERWIRRLCEEEGFEVEEE